MTPRFAALIALLRSDDQDKSFKPLLAAATKDLTWLFNNDITTVADLALLDDALFSQCLTVLQHSTIYDQLLRYLFETRAGNIRLDIDMFDDAPLALIYNVLPSYAPSVSMEALPFISNRTVERLRRRAVCFVHDLAEPFDEALLTNQSFGKPALQDLKASLMSIPDSADIAKIFIDRGLSEKQVAEHVTGLRLVDLADRSLRWFDKRNRAIIGDRLGLDNEPLTLEQAGTKYGMTRERIRQIVAKFANRVAGTIWLTETQDRCTKLLRGRTEPLYLDLIETDDAWFTNVGIHARFYANVLASAGLCDLHTWELHQRYVISRLTSEGWDEATDDARQAISSFAKTSLRHSDVRLLCELQMINRGAPELIEPFVTMVTSAFVYDEDADDPILLSIDSRMTPILRGLIDEAAEPLTIDGLKRTLAEVGSSRTTDQTVRNALAMLQCYPLGGGRYATAEMLWRQWDTSLDDACQAVEQMCKQLPGRQFHASELYYALEQSFDETLKLISSYQELNTLLRKGADLEYLNRYVWRARLDSDMGAQRIDLQQAFMRIVEEAGIPLSREQIFNTLRKSRGVSAFALILPNEEFIKVDRGRWGLVARDLKIDNVGRRELFSVAKVLLPVGSSLSEAAFLRAVRKQVPALVEPLTDYLIISLLAANRVVRRVGRSEGGFIELAQ